MQFSTIVAILSASAVFASASAVAQHPKRQGGFFYAVQEFHAGPHCSDAEPDGEATFGGANLCQAIRSIHAEVQSIKQISVTNSLPNCVAHYYTDLNCTQGEIIAPIGECVWAKEHWEPIVATNIICDV